MKKFSEKLYNISKHLLSLDRTPAQVMEECIQEKLNKSLEIYYESILDSMNFLLTKRPLSIIKKLNK